jgi:hypothetical protein
MRLAAVLNKNVKRKLIPLIKILWEKSF